MEHSTYNINGLSDGECYTSSDKDTGALANDIDSQNKSKGKFGVGNKNTSFSSSISNLNGSGKRPLKQFSVKNYNNSICSFKTPSNKPHRNSSMQDLNDFLNKHSSNSLKSINSQEGFHHSSMQRNRSIDETKRKRHHSSISNSNSFINSKQLTKTRSRNSNHSRHSKTDSPQNNKNKHSKSISPLGVQPPNNYEENISNVLDNNDNSVKSNVYNIDDDIQYSDSRLLDYDENSKQMPKTNAYKSYSNSSKTFQLESESDDDDEDIDEQQKQSKVANLNQKNETRKTAENGNPISGILAVPKIITENEKTLAADENGEITSENTSSFDSKNLLNSNHNLLKINGDDILMDQKRLSYLVPSSYRKNSRVSADRISSDMIMRRVSQSNSDLINNNIMNNLTNGNNNNSHTSAEVLANDVSLEPQNLLKEQNQRQNHLSIANIQDDEIIPSHLKHLQSNINFETEIRNEQQFVHQIPNNNRIDKVSNDLDIMDGKKQVDNADYSSFSSSFMKDKNTSHQFNYINKDFLNSSTSTEIKKYFSGADKSSETYTTELSSNNQLVNSSKGDLLERQNPKAVVDMETGLISINKNMDQSNLSGNQQSNINNLKSIQNQEEYSKPFVNQQNDSPEISNNRQLITPPEKSLGSGKLGEFGAAKASVPNGMDYKRNSYDNLYNRNLNSVKTNGINNGILNSNHSAAKSLLKIATMANSNSPPIKQIRDNGDGSFNDFNSFLKIDAPTEDRDSRTQQRLWLQRENSILDLSTDLNQNQFDAVFQASSVDAKRGFENIAKEYNTIKRFKNPLVENIKKVQNILENDNNNYSKDSGAYNVDFMNGDTATSTTTFSKSSVSNQNSNTHTSKTNTKKDYDSILSSIWNNETKKMIDSQPNKFANPNQLGGQNSHHLMRQSTSNNSYYRNSPRGIHSAGGLR